MEAFPELMSLKTLRRYVDASERTIREWISSPVNPLPAYRIGERGKWFVRRTEFDAWLSRHTVSPIDTKAMLTDLMAGL